MQQLHATLAPVNLHADPFAADMYALRLSALHRVGHRLADRVSSEHYAAYQRMVKRLEALSEGPAKAVLLDTTFYYWWHRLMEQFNQSAVAELDEWLSHADRFGVLESWQVGQETGPVSVRVNQDGQLRFPNANWHVQLPAERAGEVASIACHGDAVQITCAGSQTVIPLNQLTGKGRDPRIVPHVVLHGTSVEVDASDDFISDYFGVWFKQIATREGIARLVPARQLPPQTQQHLEECLDLLRQTWPEFAEEFVTHVQRIVPFEGGSRDAFTTTFWPGAIFIKADFGHPVYTIERMVHEGSHLRLNVIMAKNPLHYHGPTYAVSSPFKAGPRPVSGLYHGIFVFTRVAQAMTRIYEATGKVAFAQRVPHLLQQVDAATELIRNGIQLTPLAQELLEEITGEVQRLHQKCSVWKVPPLSLHEVAALGYDQE